MLPQIKLYSTSSSKNFQEVSGIVKGIYVQLVEYLWGVENMYKDDL